jgi:hypothetical protein
VSGSPENSLHTGREIVIVRAERRDEIFGLTPPHHATRPDIVSPRQRARKGQGRQGSAPDFGRNREKPANVLE